MAKYFVKGIYACYEPGKEPVLTSLQDQSLFAVQYQTSFWARPPIGKLFVFDNIRSALDWQSTIKTPFRYMNEDSPAWAGLQWFWCNVENPIVPPVGVFRGLPDWLITDYWRAYPHYIEMPPRDYEIERNKGIYMVDAVCLLRPLKWSEYVKFAGLGEGYQPSSSLV